MSLDVSLVVKVEPEPCECPNCGNTHKGTDRKEVFTANITHNLGEMADAAGIYKACWRPEEIGAVKAAQIIEPLKAGLEKLAADPERFKKLDSPNGWGRYENLVRFSENYLAACIANPDAEIEVLR